MKNLKLLYVLATTCLLTACPSKYNIVVPPAPPKVTDTGNGGDGTTKPTLVIEAIGPGALESDTSPMVFRITRSHDNLAELEVNFTLGGTATEGSDYTAPAARKFKIPANVPSFDLSIPLINDNVVEPEEDLTVTIDPLPTGYVMSSPTADMTIADDDGALVQVDKIDDTVSESGDTGSFKVSRTNSDNTKALDVKIAVSGTATQVTDYTFSTGSYTKVTIPAGSASTTVTVNPVQDDLEEGIETIIVKAVADIGYSVLPTHSSTQLNLSDDGDKASLSIAAVDATASEAGDTGTFRITRSKSQLKPQLVLTIAMSGTATNGTDYETISTSQTIAAGADSVDVVVKPKDDTEYEGAETVIATIQSSTTYAVGTAAATVTITDNDEAIPVVSITASVPQTVENGTEKGKFTIARAKASSAALTVLYTVNTTDAHTATAGTDYTALSGTATIAANATSVDVLVSPIDDTLIEGPEFVDVDLKAGSYTLDTANKSARVTIIDNDNEVLRSIQPVLAVNGMQCTTCHAKINSNVITDFGFGMSKYFSDTFGNVDAGSRLGWNSMDGSTGGYIKGQVFVPRKTFGKDIGPSWNANAYVTGSAAMSIKQLMNASWYNTYDNSALNKTTMARGIVPPAGLDSVVERDTLKIQPPTRAEILALLPTAMQTSANNEIYQVRRSTDPAIDSTIDKAHTDSTKEVSDNPQPFVRNKAGVAMKCYGDVVIKGALLLDSATIQTDAEGCRLYVTDTVAIQGVLKYQDSTGAAMASGGMVQIASGRMITLGIGLRRAAVNWAKTDSPSPLRQTGDNIDAISDGLTRSGSELNGGGWVRLSNGRLGSFDITTTDGDAIAVDLRKMGGELIDAGEHSTYCAKDTSNACTSHSEKDSKGNPYTVWDSSGTKTPAALRSEAYQTTLPSDPGNDAARLALPAYKVGSRTAINYKGLLLTAPSVQGVYLGRLQGVVVAKTGIFSIDHFDFQFDPTYTTAKKVLPLLLHNLIELSAQ